ncbi:CaiF/GrlA family transcriptional regulator [Salmonella enterica]|nr:CaiF/GrlA family transcriptional regulator [Salmonella enterica subsp. enterica serovar Chester]EEC5652684.1 CaiF/GrlA family transcriptional regulator [Salmonella enterica]
MNKNNCSVRDGNCILKQGNQRNHGEYVVPTGMEMWFDEPLYLLIARWCLMQKRWINRNDIAIAFHLTDRRASFQLYYIIRNKSKILSCVRNINIRNNRTEIWVKKILLTTSDSKTQIYNQVQNKAKSKMKHSSRGVGSGMMGNVTLWDELLNKVR